MIKPIEERLYLLKEMFVRLENTSGRLDKEAIVNHYKRMCSQLSQDIDYAFEILTGQHKIGFIINIPRKGDFSRVVQDEYCSLETLLVPIMSMEDHTQETIYSIEKMYAGLGDYLNELLNRNWKLGINKSQLAIKDISPMLAKKFSYEKLPGTAQSQRFEEYYITEKLDGNRCIAKYNVQLNKWEFFSRSGKLHKATFDMKELPTCYIYDGEILSETQLYNPSQENFNTLSGALNSKYGDKSDLVYVIFDIIDCNTKYDKRRGTLNDISLSRHCDSNVHILPVLKVSFADNVFKDVEEQLKIIEDYGGEGVMVNLGSRYYEHKRTDSLLKVKSVYTMDMRVVGLLPGTGKYEGLVGSLICEAFEDDGPNVYNCKVGSGLGDYERETWARNPDKIIGKIVEVAYFSVSQDISSRGTCNYSLRFPRFKGIRDDKDTTSIY